MSRRRKREIVLWARYINRYAHIPRALVGGRAAYAVVFVETFRRGSYRSIRRQSKHRFVNTGSQPAGSAS